MYTSQFMENWHVIKLVKVSVLSWFFVFFVFCVVETCTSKLQRENNTNVNIAGCKK